MICAYDLEILSNHFLAVFYDGIRTWKFTHDNPHEMRAFLMNRDLILVGWNNHAFDDLFSRRIVANPNIGVDELHALCKRIISSRQLPKDLFTLQYSAISWSHSIDMYMVCGKPGSLKEMECREHMKTVFDAPIDFEAPLAADKVKDTLAYCIADVKATWFMYQKYMKWVELRRRISEMYDLGNRPYVQADAALAQSMFLKRHEQRTGQPTWVIRDAAKCSMNNRRRNFNVGELLSKRVQFKTKEMMDFQTAFAATDIVGDEAGTKWEFEDGAWGEPITLGGNQFQLGVGGLHSCDPPGIFRSTKDVKIAERDVLSFYPSIIIVEGLYPSQLGPAFLKDYTDVRDRRTAAKHRVAKIKKELKSLEKNEGNHYTPNQIDMRREDLSRDLFIAQTETDAYKLAVNSSFGLFGNQFAPMRSVDCMLRTTVNGQVFLLMLVEALELAGVRVLSGNTDGVVYMWHRDRQHVIDQIVKEWQIQTGHELEETEYKLYARANVNNYLAVKVDGERKYKGSFELLPMNGKSDNRAAILAAQAWLIEGIPIADTINAITKIEDLIFYQRVKNGGDLYYGDERLGKTARWYASVNGKAIRRKNPPKEGKPDSYATIPDGHKATLAMTLPDCTPNDLDRSHYIRAAIALVESVTKVC